MFTFRRAAVRALQSPSLHRTTSKNARSFITASSDSWRSSPSSLVRLHSSSFVQRSIVLPTRRGYATEDEKESRVEVEQDSRIDEQEVEIEGRKEHLSSVDEPATDFAATRRPSRGPREFSSNRTTNYPPNNTLYVGNLYFESSEESLKEEFQQIGEVKSVKIIYDGRGLSKGFGYVEFEDISTATRAREELDNRVFGGRNILVQFAAANTARRPRGPTGEEGFQNPPSKTLFVGNMSYEMTDKDLNELFKDVKNVLEVRVAVDRRTSQPRGFAHADFVDTKSAEAGAEYLKSKEFYGRRLRIDFSTSAKRHTGPPRGAREPADDEFSE